MKRIHTLTFVTWLAFSSIAASSDLNCGHQAVIGFFELEKYGCKSEGEILQALKKRFPYESSNTELMMEIMNRGDDIDAPFKMDYKDRRLVFSLACMTKVERGNKPRKVSRVVFGFGSNHKLENLETDFTGVDTPSNPTE
ncbi:hypothetical protein [Pelagicoccus mobilis]|uniref:DUF3718 domain-containing protein n=1 Tax=Pelagicoccus mobilis TaxID=415221 RepID=A0A934RYA8_9BACT|nr:hypothetical protein [Pelagicoccus mobilis]MBK1875763.1 hypothetical protein [Pelagicoccus mobilis]